MSKIITDADKLTDATQRVNKQSNALDTLIQSVLAGATFFAVKDGNITPINAAVLAMSKGVRKPAAANWLMKYAPVVANDNKEGAKEQPFKFSKEKLETILAAFEGERDAIALAHAELANAVMWSDYKEPPLVPETWNLIEAITKLAKQATDYQGKNVKVTGADLIAKLQALTVKAEAPAGL